LVCERLIVAPGGGGFGPDRLGVRRTVAGHPAQAGSEQLREQMLEQERASITALEREVNERKVPRIHLSLVESIPHYVIRKTECRYTFVNSTTKELSELSAERFSTDDSVQRRRRGPTIDDLTAGAGDRRDVETVRPSKCPAAKVLFALDPHPVVDQNGEIVVCK
jgi:hypothetical protein